MLYLAWNRLFHDPCHVGDWQESILFSQLTTFTGLSLFLLLVIVFILVLKTQN